MPRVVVAIATSLVAALLAPAGASAKMIQIGGSPTEQGNPTCPGKPCLAITRTTGYQEAGLRSNPYLVTQPGSIVAMTIALGSPSKAQISFFDKQFGPASARLTILHPRSRRKNNFYFVVRGQSDVFQLKSYFGKTVDFAMKTAIPVVKGDLVGLTAPSWAPVLASGLSNNSTWRASRGPPCNSNDTTFKQTARQRIGQVAQYACQYKTARLTYSALEVSTP